MSASNPQTTPELLTKDECRALQVMAENLWDELQTNKLGGYSGVNRPFYITSCFREVIEKFGHRDTGYTWSKEQIDNGKK
jgi:hypothetical protein